MSELPDDDTLDSARLADDHLELVKRVVLDDVYLDNELRIAYLASCAAKGTKPQPQELHSPTFNRAEREATARNGRTATDGGATFALSAMGRTRLDHLHVTLDRLRDDGIEGDLVECGTGRGGGGVFLRAHARVHPLPPRTVWIVDRFRASIAGLGPAQLVDSESGQLRPFTADLNAVRDAFDRLDLLDDRVRFIQGDYASALDDGPIGQIALLRIGESATPDLATILDHLYGRVTEGGTVIVEMPDTDLVPILDAAGISASLRRIDQQTTTWTRPASRLTTSVEAPRTRVGTVDPDIDLSIVVVFWNMRREAARTLHSLSRAYQTGLGGHTTEIIVVDNGSSPDQRLDPTFVEAFGPEFRLIDLGDEATPSPATALNVGTAHATGRNIAFMVDGAHLLSPGVFDRTLRCLALYEPAVVLTQPWYVGPGQQPDMSVQGYGTETEDNLFDLIDWPHDGQRLFEIGHPIGERDWFDPLAESCFIAAPRAVVEQLGAFDEAFDQPGGGYANLDLFERLTAHPETNIVSLLGEATFHQFHGGTTTSDEAGTRANDLRELASHYELLRGRSFRVQGGRPFAEHGRVVQYVGEFPPVARLTRARRRISELHARSAPTDRGLPVRRHPIATELRDVYVDAVWHSAYWQETTWLGQPVDVSTDDLWFMQQLIAETRPEVIVDIGSTPGHSRFLASMCALNGIGSVIRVEGLDGADVEHDRLETIRTDDPTEDDTLAAVEAVAAGREGMIVLGGRSTRAGTTVTRFRAYRRFVAPGSHAVIENTIVNGNPVWESHGPGPGQAVQAILQQHPDFTIDPTADRLPVSFNTGGYLRRSPTPDPRLQMSSS